jgi:YggT family protein
MRTIVKENAAERGCPSGGGRIALTPPVAAEHPMRSLLEIFLMLLSVMQFIILAHIIMSWLINFQVLNIRQPLVSQIWTTLNNLLEPIYSRVRRMLPYVSGLDLAPLIVLLVIYGLRIILLNNQALFI